MTAQEIWDQINNFVEDKNANECVWYIISELRESNKESEAIKYIKDFFKCDINTAKDTFEIFKNEMGELLSPQQIAYANAIAREALNKPKCPTCNSTNIKKISGTAKVAGAVTFGLFSKTARSQFKCKNCGYKW